MAIFLINAGAEVSTQAKNGCTAFDMASLIGKSFILSSEAWFSLERCEKESNQCNVLAFVVIFWSVMKKHFNTTL